MNTWAKTQSMILEWKAAGIHGPELAVKIANACIGWPYVYGGRGEKCTPSGRKSRANDKYPTIVSKCQVLSGKSDGCAGCAYYPGGNTLFFDCRGFTYWVFNQAAGIKIQGAGATSQYNDASNWAQRGPIAQMPKDKVCCAFRYDKGTGKYEHTLIYDGAGNYIHCSGEVKKVAAGKYAATHYAIPKGLYQEGGKTLPEPEKGQAIVAASKLALRKEASTNASVITRADIGETVKILPESEEWLHVEYKGKTGYMMRKYLKEGE